jgi:hypothetical protein
MHLAWITELQRALNVPLEETYASAFSTLPSHLRHELSRGA